MSAGETIDVVNEGGEVVDTITREQAERDNHLTPNVLIFVFNSAGEVWAQLRPMSKNHYPGRWDISACGGVISGETPEQAAKRECLEELGFAPELQHVETFLNVFPGDQGEERRRLSHLYIGISDEQPQTGEEVDEFKAWDIDALRADVEQHPEAYVPSFMTELEMALEARGQ